MTKKMKKESGFTLVEMLIVVAIIAILIAVSIPLVSSSLERAREAADAANERAFKMVLVTGYLLNDAGMDDGPTKIVAGKPYYFDAVEGVAKEEKLSVAYGQSDGTGSSPVNAKGNVLIGEINTDGSVKMGWVEVSADAVPDNAELVSDSLVKTNS